MQSLRFAKHPLNYTTHLVNERDYVIANDVDINAFL